MKAKRNTGASVLLLSQKPQIDALLLSAGASCFTKVPNFIDVYDNAMMAGSGNP